MANVRDQQVDKTYLSIDNAERRGFIHRDYLAHCLRWSHVCKHLAEKQRYKTAKILDVGCGRELPLAKTLYSSRYIPLEYVGIDYGPINQEAIDVFASGKFPLVVSPQTDFLDFEWQGAKPNLITCFEVLEHVEPAHCVRMLRHMRNLISDDGYVLISTPCYDEKVGPADNHVNEITYRALAAVLGQTGWTVHDHWGTFASIRDYEHLLAADGLDKVFERLRGYYDTNYLATVFAPLYPGHSRNCLWKLRPNHHPASYHVPTLAEIPTPWGSSERWKELDPSSVT